MSERKDNPTATLSRLAAENERLRAALRPFAEYAAAFEANVSTLFANDDPLWRCPRVADLTLGDCRRASAALNSRREGCDHDFKRVHVQWTRPMSDGFSEPLDATYECQRCGETVTE